MIYKISAVNMPLVFSKGGEIITTNIDGINCLVKNLTDITNVSIVESYEDSEEETLLSMPEWQGE